MSAFLEFWDSPLGLGNSTTEGVYLEGLAHGLYATDPDMSPHVAWSTLREASSGSRNAQAYIRYKLRAVTLNNKSVKEPSKKWANFTDEEVDLLLRSVSVSNPQDLLTMELVKESRARHAARGYV